jgi:hypothetical protein
MHITRDLSARTISMDQSKYLRDILAKYDMLAIKPSTLPMDPGFLSGLVHMASIPLTGVAKEVYQSLLGSLQYAAVCTCPNVTTVVETNNFCGNQVATLQCWSNSIVIVRM